jgi:hypothetical protein
VPICSSDTTTLRLRPGTPAWLLPVPAGRWRREPDGSVVARYERGDGDELAAAIEVWGILYGEVGDPGDFPKWDN